MNAICETKRYVILCVFKTNLLCVRYLRNALRDLATDCIKVSFGNGYGSVQG